MRKHVIQLHAMGIGHHLCDNHLQRDPLVERIPEDALLRHKASQNAPNHRRRHRAGQRRKFRKFLAADLQEFRGVIADARQHQVADVLDQVLEDPTEVTAGFRQPGNHIHRIAELVGEDVIRQCPQFRSRRQSEGVDDILLANRLRRRVAAAEGDHLVKNRLRVAHPAVRRTGDRRQCGVLDKNLLRIRNLTQPLGNQRHRNAPQVETLASRDDGRQHLVRLRRRKEELHVRRRLLQRLEQGVPRARREHVHFVNDVNLVAAFGRGILDLIADGPHVIHPIMGGAVNLHHIQRISRGDLAAVLAFTARLAIFQIQTVERFGENAGGSRLANSPRAHEKIGVSDALRVDGVLQRAGDMLLPDHLR